MKEGPPKSIGGPEAGPRSPFPFFYRIIHHGPTTPTTIEGVVNGFRKEDGGVNHKHPDIAPIMKEAKKKKLDVGIIPKGLHTMVVWGRNLVDKDVKNWNKKKIVKVSAGVAITTAAVGGASFIALRMHRKPRKEK